MADSILTVSDLSCEAGGKTVLHGLNVRIERHAVTAVIGPNGCGKSTLLGCMCRLRQPSAGEITLNGRSIRTY
ncbi:MAG: ABC transporter ATP-binding protein, partial [Megasphaera micronuciformis]|nr:ABC transporter ATP-binding protein [Megasphaera micronuciformis]